MKTKLLFTTLALLSVSAYAQTDWVNYANNPVIDSTFDASAIGLYGPNVLFDGTSYHMWYTRESSEDVEKIGYATSVDGLSWTLTDSLALEPSTDITRFDAEKVGQPAVILDNGVFKMWYWGAGPNGNSIGYATSTDGSNWTKVDGSGTDLSVYDAVMDGSGSYGLTTPTVVKDGSTYHMWYSSLTISTTVNFRIGYATSTDGITWTHVAGAGTGGTVIDLTTGSFDENSAYFPCVVKNGSEFEMWYAGSDDQALEGGWRIGYATSTDGTSWTKIAGSKTKGSVIDSSICPSVTITGSTYRMWYNSANGVCYATSGAGAFINELSDNAKITIHPNPSTGKFIIDYPSKNKEMSFEIYNVIGEKVLQLQNTNKIDLSSSPKGTYLIKIKDGDKHYTKEIVVQ